MLTERQLREKELDSRPQVSLAGVARILGLKRTTAYNRRQRGILMILDDVPFVQTRTCLLYDMQTIFEKVVPTADGNKIADLMYEFIQKNGNLVS